MNLKRFEKIVLKILWSRSIKIIAQTKFALKSAEALHRLTYRKRYRWMMQAIERFKNCVNKKQKFQIKKEMLLCKKFWGCYPLHYYRYNLYQNDKKLSENELLNYIPEFFFYYLFLPFHNSREFESLVSDKNITEQLFRNLAIPQADTICKLINHHIYTNRSSDVNFGLIERELQEKQYQKIFVKPNKGEGGHGIYIFNRNNNGRYTTKDNDVFNEDFLRKIGKNNDYIIQPGLEQVPELSKFYPYSVNTYRIATDNKNGTVRILCAILRFGRNGTQLDNSDQGGIFVTVDAETGKLGDYATSMLGERFEKHPDTKINFREQKNLHWGEIREFVIQCAKKIPQFRYLGWDVAQTKNGPIAIEVNYGFSLDGLQIIFGGLREILGIDVPKYYWENMGKRT